MHIASARSSLASGSPAQNPLRGADQQKSRSRNLGFVPWQNFATTPTVAAILPRNATELSYIARRIITSRT
jgi:hypothetical protein